MFQKILAKQERLVVGLMSGTSADGIDVALVKIDGQGPDSRFEILAFDTLKFSPPVHDLILAGQGSKGAGCKEIILLSSYMGELFAHAVSHICKKAGKPLQEVDLVGSHGQTLFHQPIPEKMPGFAVSGSLQIGNAAIIAERTGITVVSDFRSRDMAAGGQGAPLAPYLDYVLYNHRSRSRIVINIGGIANMTALPSDTSLEHIVAFDSGPGNCLIDIAMSHFTSGKLGFDRDGSWGSAGKCNDALLNHLMEHPYFKMPPPKSAEKEMFGKAFFQDVLNASAGMAPADVVATLTAFTVRSISVSIMEHLMQKARYEELILSGGGALNPNLMNGLAEAFPKLAVTRYDSGAPAEGVGDYVIPGRAKEAVLIAFLANETLACNPGNVPSATGAKREVVLGSITPGLNAIDS